MDASSFLASIRAYFGVILLMGVAAGMAAFGLSTVMPKQYTAEARVFVGSLTDANYDQLLAYQQLAQTYAQLATTTPVLSRLIVNLGLADTTDQLAARIEIKAPTGLSIIRVIATAPSPAAAAMLANAMAMQISNLATTPGKDVPSLASVVQRAVPPSSPSSPRVLLNTMVAAALGYALGLALAAALYQRRRVQAADETSPGVDGAPTS